MIAPGASYPLITVTGTVTGAAGSTISIPITITGGGLTTAGSSQGSVPIVSPLTISKAFGSNSIGVSATTTLTFTVTNPSANTVAQTGLAFSDTFPANLVVAPTPGVNSTCGGTPTATAGAGVVSLTGGTVGVNSTCMLAVNVTSATAGSYQASAATVSSTNGGTGSDANATQPTLGVVAFPTVTKAFGAGSVPLNGTTSLSFTVTNPAANAASLTNIGFTDSLPVGLVVAAPSGLTGACGGGTITGTAGSTSVSLASATLTAPSGSCTFSVNVTATTVGAKNNAITAISSTQSGTGTINSTATLTVLGPPTISDAFGAASVPLNGASTSLTFTLTNPSGSTALAGVAFTDTLPAGLVIATPSGLASTCNGTATAAQATTAISLTAGTLAAGVSCTVALNVTGTAVGAQANTSGAVSSTNGGTGVASNTATLAVLGPPTISEAFNPGGIAVNATSALTFTVTNPAANTLALAGVGFIDTLPANTMVASPNGLVNNCGGTATAVAGSNNVSLSGVSLTTATPTNTCTLVVNVTATQAGSFTNTTAAVTSANGGTGLTASASLTAAAPPTITKSFLPTSIPLNGTSALSFTVMSPAGNPASLTNIAFTDALPTGLLVSTPNGLIGTCGGGTISAAQATNSVGLSGATLAPGASCTFSVNVTASAGGAKSNTTAAISSTQSGAGATSNTAILTVVLPPIISDAFGAPSVPLSGTSTSLTFTLTNPNASTALTGVAFADTLPAGLVIASPNGLTDTCNGTPAATAGSGAIGLTGGTLAAGGSCTVVLNVTGTAVGALSNTSGAVSSTEGGTGTASNAASLAVLGPPTISKAFGASGVPVNGVTSLTFTLTNPVANALALTGVGFTDPLPTNIAVATPNGLVNTCGGTPTATAGAGTVSLSGVTLATSGTCTLAVNVTATQAGTFNNTTSTVSSTNGGTGLTASASLNAAAPPTVSDLFGTSSIPANTSTSLSFTVTNPSANTVSLTNISFADTLPAGLAISTPNGLTGSCGGGTITAVQATNSISLTGATLAPNSPCTFSVNVTGTGAGTLSNTTGAISSTQSGAGATSNTQTLTVVAPPTFSKAFGASGIGANASTTLTFTLTNPAANTVALTGVSFSDTFPAGIQLTGTPVASNTCGVTPTAAANTGIVSVSGVTLATGNTCTLVVNVTATAPGAFNNVTGAVSSTNGGNGLTASATLSAAAAPTISKIFGASGIALNDLTSLSFTVTNPAANTLSLTNIAFTDALPAGLVVTTPNGLTGSCGGGAIGATGGATVTFTSSNASAASVQSVRVPSGSSSTSFTVNTLVTTAPAQTKITATFNGTNTSQQMWIDPPGTPYLSSIVVSPKSVEGGVSSPRPVLTITLSGPAPSGGAVVAVQSDVPGAFTFGSARTFTVSPGATSQTFNINTNSVTSTTSVSLTGDYNGPAGTSVTIYPTPVLASVTIAPDAATGGSTNPTGTVTLSGAAPSGNATVSLSSNSSYASVPPNVMITAGTTSTTFTVTTTAPTTQQSATITASYVGSPIQTGLIVTPASTPVLASIATNATLIAGTPTVVGATSGTITGTVTIDGPAPSGGAMVTLFSNDTSAVQVPATVTIPATSTSTTFTVTTFATNTTGQTLVTLSGTYGGVTQIATLGVDPPLAITPNNIFPVAALGIPYPANTAIGQTTGIGPFTYTFQSGTSLPNGLTLNTSTGVITGAPSPSDTPGTYNFTLTLTDGQSHVSAPVTLSIQVVDPTNACGPASDPRHVLNGGYAALLQGWGTVSGVSYPVAEIFRFTANGDGTIGSAGTMDLNTGSSTFPYQQISILTSSTYSVAADNSGCMQLKTVGTFGGSNTTVNTIVFHFAATELNGPSSQAMIGRIIQFDNYSGTGLNTAGTGFDMTGVMHYQDLSFLNISTNNTSGLANRFAFGTDGEVQLSAIRNAAAAYLNSLRIANRAGDSDRQAAEELAGMLGGLPLALEQAAAYIQATCGTLAGYLALFRQRRAELLARSEPTVYGKTVASTPGASVRPPSADRAGRSRAASVAGVLRTGGGPAAPATASSAGARRSARAGGGARAGAASGGSAGGR